MCLIKAFGGEEKEMEGEISIISCTRVKLGERGGYCLMPFLQAQYLFLP